LRVILINDGLSGWRTNMTRARLTIVEVYFHEILHAASLHKSEQETLDLQWPLIEQFLGTMLPEERKKMKASDYYSKKSS
jgi:hypothetical protein